MKIVRCSKCGKYFYKVNKCFYCGDTSEINEVRESVIHDNAAAQYYKMESALRSNGTAFPKVSEPRGSQRGQGPLRIRSGVVFSDAFPLRGRWRGGHAATDEVSLDTRRIAENAGKIHRLSTSSASRCSAPSRQGEGLGVGQGLST